MLNKKGLTIVELMAVLVIISLVSIIAVLAYNSLSTNYRKKQSDNIIKNIKVAANIYFNDKHTQFVLVDTLIKENYLNVKDFILVDPTDKSKAFNCFIATKEGNVYLPDNADATGQNCN